MRLDKLSLINFKNFESQSFDFQNRINCFVGDNGIGKTNALDAIYYLSFGKSYFNPIASQNIRHDQDFFMVQGEYLVDERKDTVICSLKRGKKKSIKRNDKEYERFSDHIGYLPLVIISPADRDLIIEGSERRRKFIDSVISQSDKSYLKLLINYNKVLLQRNTLLKYFAANRTFDALNLKVYDEQLENLGESIHNKRKDFLTEFTPIFEARYESISNGKESVSLKYKTQLDEGKLSDLLEKSIERDRILQYTSVGLHKDDLQFEISDYPIKKFGSQGQQKSFLIALKLAEFDFIKSQSKVKPILLLDDIFDKLDEKRVSQIIELVNQDDFGQIFISDTHADRTEEVVKKTNQSYQLFKL
jgi:DNA replication and repair protein RecF